MVLKNSAPEKSQLNILLSYFQNKQYVNAEKLALSITKKYPSHQYAWKILAAVFEQTDRVSDALLANQQALKIEPDDPEAHLCLGNNFNLLGRMKEAELSYKQSIKLDANYFQAYYNLGFILKKMQRLEESASNYRQAIKLKPDFPQGYYNLGLTLIELNSLDEALKNLKKAIKLKPNYFQAFFNLAIINRKLGQREEALTNLKHTITLSPKHVRSYNVLGITLAELGLYEEAIASFQEAILLDPKYEDAYNNLGNSFKELGRFDEALESYKKAIELDPDNPENLNNFGRFLMLINNFKEAFKFMEWRLKTEELNFIPLKTLKPRWHGDDKKKIFLLKEQGIGDQIMFSSMIPEIYDNADKLIVECDHRILPIFQRSLPNNIKYITDRMEVSDNEYDCQIPIGSLPLHFRKELIDFKKSSRGWLKADQKKVKNIRQNIIQNKSKKIIGVSWRTSSLLTNSHLRNIELAKMLEPLKNLDLIFVNLQYGEVSNEIDNLRSEYGVEVLEMPGLDLFSDIDSLAALISACDYIISIDNLNSHFAGALGVKTMLLLPKVADERWGLEPNKTYLYDSLVLYRQSSYNDWNETLKKIKTDIQNLV